MKKLWSVLYVILFFTRPSLAKNEQSLAKSSKISFQGEKIKWKELWKTNFKLINFTDDQQKKINDAAEIIKKIITTAAFKERILNYKFQGKKAFNNNQGLSNEEIYQKIIEGAELQNGQIKDHSMDIEIELFYEKNKTIGYTYSHTKRVWINDKYFAQYDAVKVADNLMHEWMHKLGFEHSYEWNKDRDHSVPYAVGYILEELALQLPERQLLQNEEKKQERIISSSED